MLGRISKLLLAKGELEATTGRTWLCWKQSFASGSKAFVKYSPVSSLWISSNRGGCITDTPTVEQKRNIYLPFWKSGSRYLNVSSVSSNPGMKIYGPIAEFFCYVFFPPGNPGAAGSWKGIPSSWKRGFKFQLYTFCNYFYPIISACSTQTKMI